MIAVVETEEFLDSVMPETGGLRKLRWTAKGKGKRGGSRRKSK
jgi:hypothetical protein